MIPILFEANETDVATHGIGDLIDCISCECEMTAEGEYELSFIYPMTGELFSELTIGRLVFVKANPWQAKQLFRIYGFEKNLDGTLQVNCQHISYDLANIPVQVFHSNTNATCQQTLNAMIPKALAITGDSIYNYTFTSDIMDPPHTEDHVFWLETPSSVRAALLDGDDSIQGCYGGDLIFDNYNVQLLNVGGENRGVVIEYGVDLIDYKQEQNISEMATGVFPYFRYSYKTDDGYEDRFTYGQIQYTAGDFITHRVIPLDLTSYFPNQEDGSAPAAWQLEAKAREWMAEEKGFGEPKVNLTISYAMLGQDIRLYDAVTVRFVKMGKDVTSKVISYKYDVLKEKPLEVQISNTKEAAIFSLEDASRLRKGLLPPERIKNQSITSEKYAPGSVRGGGGGGGGGGASHDWHLAGGGALAKDGVKSENIEDQAVTTPKIHTYAVTAETMADLSVPSRSIQDGAVITMKIGDLQVANIKLYQGARDAIAKVWEIDQLVAGRIYANGTVSCTGFILNGTQAAWGSILDGTGTPRTVMQPIGGGY